MIYTITVGEKDEEFGIGVSRCVGYLFNLKDAQHAVLFNQADIFEHFYTLAVIEEVEEGLYSVPRKEWWYEWSYDTNKCKLIDKPEQAKNSCSFGIG